MLNPSSQKKFKKVPQKFIYTNKYSVVIMWFAILTKDSTYHQTLNSFMLNLKKKNFKGHTRTIFKLKGNAQTKQLRKWKHV